MLLQFVATHSSCPLSLHDCCWMLSFDMCCLKILRQMGPGKLMMDRERLAQRVLELERERDALQAALSTRDAELEERTAEVATLRTQLEYSEAERWSFHEQLHDANLALEAHDAVALQATLNEREEQLAAANEENYNLSGQIDALLEEKGELEDSLLEAQDARDVMEGNLNDAEEVIAQRNATIAHLQAANDALHAIVDAHAGPLEPIEVMPPDDDMEMSDDEDASDIEDGAPPSPMRDGDDYDGDDDE